jgi:hypothetical protein
MSDRENHAALATLDLAIGSAAAGLGRPLRWAAGVHRAAAPVRARALRAARTAARRLPLPDADQLRAEGGALRESGRATVASLVQELAPRLVEAVLDQLDLTDLVTRRVDIDAIIRHVDIDAIIQHVDIDAVVARVDLDAAVTRVDLIGVAEDIVDGIDLPKIIRDSTGSMASEGIREARLHSVEADEAVSHFVDRVLLRRRPRRTDTGLGGSHDAPA